ncbi:MAG: hypothetical protein FJ291_20770 [Planctomycetes bacterium]|nr:hypothetical protein [Planctomycetota bacterium]
MTMRPLTVQQERVLAFLEGYVGEHGFPPTLREIGEAIGLSNVSAVRGHVAALERKGYIARTPQKARSVSLIPSPSPMSRLKRRLHEMLGTDQGVLHRVVYGLAWTTWQRRPHFAGPLRDRMAEAIDREALEHGWRVLERRVEPDHVVVVLEVWPNHSAEQTVHRLQSAGKALRRRHPEAFPDEQLWGRGYVVTTDLALLDELLAKLLNEQSQSEGSTS